MDRRRRVMASQALRCHDAAPRAGFTSGGTACRRSARSPPQSRPLAGTAGLFARSPQRSSTRIRQRCRDRASVVAVARARTQPTPSASGHRVACGRAASPCSGCTAHMPARGSPDRRPLRGGAARCAPQSRPAPDPRRGRLRRSYCNECSGPPRFAPRAPAATRTWHRSQRLPARGEVGRFAPLDSALAARRIQGSVNIALRPD